MRSEAPDVLGFQGQNTQEIGMGEDIAAEYPEAQEVFDQADDVTKKLFGNRISDICFQGPRELLEENSQLAVLVTSAAAVAVLRKKGLLPRSVAGHSLGEYSALLTAGVFGTGFIGLKKAIELVHERQIAAKAANREIEGGGAMMAVSGKNVEQSLKDLAEGFEVDVAAINTGDQGVLSGPEPHIDAAEEEIKARDSLRGMKLNIGSAYHSRWFRRAQELMVPVFEEIEFHRAKMIFFANNAQIIKEPKALKEHLLNMHIDPVRFRDQSLEMARQGMRSFTEVGRSKVLSKFVSKTVGEHIQIRPLEELLGKTEK